MLILQAGPGRVRDLAFTADGSTLAIHTDSDRQVWLWDLQSGESRTYTPHPHRRISSMAIAPKHKLIATANEEGQVVIFDLATQREAFRFVGGPRNVTCMAFAPDATSLAAGGDNWWGSIAEVRRWDLLRGREQPALRGHRGAITAIAFTPDGKTLASGSRDKSIRLWDLQTGHERTGFAARLADWFRKLSWVATPEDERAQFANRAEIRSLAFAPAGTTLAAATGWSTTLWEIDWSDGGERSGRHRVVRGKVLADLRGHQRLVDSVDFSPSGRLLATGCRDGQIKFWSIPGGHEMASFCWEMGKVYRVAFAPDGLRIAAGGDAGQVLVWDVDED